MKSLIIDRQHAAEVLKTLRDVERVFTARDTVNALHAGKGSVDFAPLTMDTIRAREWLEDQLAEPESVFRSAH